MKDEIQDIDSLEGVIMNKEFVENWIVNRNNDELIESRQNEIDVNCIGSIRKKVCGGLNTLGLMIIYYTPTLLFIETGYSISGL